MRAENIKRIFSTQRVSSTHEDKRKSKKNSSSDGRPQKSRLTSVLLLELELLDIELLQHVFVSCFISEIFQKK